MLSRGQFATGSATIVSGGPVGGLAGSRLAQGDLVSLNGRFCFETARVSNGSPFSLCASIKTLLYVNPPIGPSRTAAVSNRYPAFHAATKSLP